MPRKEVTRRQVVLTSGALLGWGATAWAQVPNGERVLRIVGPWEINGLDPAITGYLFTRLQVGETLTDADDAGRPLAGLASTWTVSPDQLRWRFSLRPGARFHDGTPVTAAQVVRVLQRAKAQPGPLQLAPLASIDADGADALVLRLQAPFAALPALLAHSNTMVLAASSFDARGAVTAIVGSGPYRIASLQAPQKFEIVACDGWTGTKPTITRASYLSAGRAETRALMAESQQADLAFGLDPASLLRLRRHGRVRIEAVTIPRTVMLKVNAGHRWLQDRRARAALSLALDRNGIASGLLRDPEMAATQLFPPTLAEWHLPTLPALRHDPAAARQLLAELGWQPGPDRMLVRGGERFALTLRTFPDRPELPLLAAAIQEQLRQVGIAVEVAVGNSSEIPAGHRNGTLELGLAARNYALVPDPIGTLLQDFGGDTPGKTGGDWGAMNWRHDALAQALAELARGAAPERRAALRGQVAQVLQDELPIIPISWYRQNAAVSARLGPVRLDPLERSYRLTDLRWRNGAGS